MDSSSSTLARPTYADVEDAARSRSPASRTARPSRPRAASNARTGAEVFFKCENLQRAGAFKFRGAYNALSRLSTGERRRGVVTFSSGNHAQAIALAGQLLDIPRVIVMPSDAPAVKRSATEAYGGEVVLYDRDRDDREAIGRRLAAERGLTLIPPYDHPHIIAGQGTAAQELIDEVGALDYLLSPAAAAACSRAPRYRPPRSAPDAASLASSPRRATMRRDRFARGRCRRIDNPKTVADGARTPSLGSLTFAIVLRNGSRHGDGRRSDAASRDVLPVGAVKLVVEPTGALGAAALFENRIDAPRQTGRRHPQRRKRRSVARRRVAATALSRGTTIRSVIVAFALILRAGALAAQSDSASPRDRAPLTAATNCCTRGSSIRSARPHESFPSSAASTSTRSSRSRISRSPRTWRS